MHLECLSKAIPSYSSKYENCITLGDFNGGADNNYIQVFCNTFNFGSLIAEPTCYKNPENPSCIDLILTNRPRSFQDSSMFETFSQNDCNCNENEVYNT